MLFLGLLALFTAASAADLRAAEPLGVVQRAPEGDLDSLEAGKEVVITFNRPMVSLGSAEDMGAFCPCEITPPIPPPGLERRSLCLEDGRPAQGGCAASEEWIQKRALPSLAGRGPRLVDPLGKKPGLRIDFPRDGEVFVIDPQAGAAEQAFRPRIGGSAEGVWTWKLDGEDLGQARPWVPLAPGEHRLQLASCGRALDEVIYKVLE